MARPLQESTASLGGEETRCRPDKYCVPDNMVECIMMHSKFGCQIVMPISPGAFERIRVLALHSCVQSCVYTSVSIHLCCKLPNIPAGMCEIHFSCHASGHTHVAQVLLLQ